MTMNTANTITFEALKDDIEFALKTMTCYNDELFDLTVEFTKRYFNALRHYVVHDIADEIEAVDHSILACDIVARAYNFALCDNRRA